MTKVQIDCAIQGVFPGTPNQHVGLCVLYELVC